VSCGKQKRSNFCKQGSTNFASVASSFSTISWNLAQSSILIALRLLRFFAKEAGNSVSNFSHFLTTTCCRFGKMRTPFFFFSQTCASFDSLFKVKNLNWDAVSKISVSFIQKSTSTVGLSRTSNSFKFFRRARIADGIAHDRVQFFSFKVTKSPNHWFCRPNLQCGFSCSSRLSEKHSLSTASKNSYKYTNRLSSKLLVNKHSE